MLIMRSTNTNQRGDTMIPANTQKKTAHAKIDSLPYELNISQTVRWLLNYGLDRGDVVRYFKTHFDRDIKYQQVRNIELTPLKKR